MQQRVSGVDAKFSLAWLLQPLTVDTFLNEIWGADHYHLKRNCPGYFDGLLRFATVEERRAGLFATSHRRCGW
jgi:hypothetical protein